MSFILVLHEGVDGFAPGRQEAKDYHEAINEPDYPVLSDVDEVVADAIPYDDSTIPGKCVLSPGMEIVKCMTGHGLDEMFDAIQDHAGTD